jgi:uncharacterized protein YecA (UPF0149 family)
MVNRPKQDTGAAPLAEHVHGPDCQHDHDHPGAAGTYRRDLPKLGRNDPCHCGSGKKFKKCHGQNAQ